MNAYLTKNAYEYEIVHPPPPNLPAGMMTFYITDSDKTKEEAESLGWDVVKKSDIFTPDLTKLQRRQAIGRINCFPQEFAPEVLDFRFVFVSDSNIITLWDDYHLFVEGCDESKALFVTSGCYKGGRDNIEEEGFQSIKARWEYNAKEIGECTYRYVRELNEKGVNVPQLSVVITRFIGWNLRHPQYEFLANKMNDEYAHHLQGNIILTYLSGMYPEWIFNYRVKNHNSRRTGRGSHHRYEA